MALTVTEKEHWKNRISRQIEKRKEQLIADQRPGLMDEINKRSEDRAWESLGIKELREKAEALKKEERHIRDQISDIWKSINRKFQRPDGRSGYLPDSSPSRAVTDAVKARTRIYKEEILKESEFGRNLLSLEREKDEMLDTVWLATSPKQIKQLWGRVVEALKGTMTDLQKEAMDIVPLDD